MAATTALFGWRYWAAGTFWMKAPLMKNSSMAATMAKMHAFATVDPFQKKRKSATTMVANASTKLGMIFAAVACMIISFSGLK